MAQQIKIDVARMQELSNRLDELCEQLKASNQVNNEAINNITSNIKGSEVINTLNLYQTSCEAITNSTYGLLLDVAGTLKSKISKYSQTEQEAANTLTDVQSILQGLE